MATSSVKYLKFGGAFYRRATYQELNTMEDLDKKEEHPVLREIDSGILHVESVVAESKEMLVPAQQLLAHLKTIRKELHQCLHKDRPHSNDVSLLDADTRAEVTGLVKTIEKYNRALNYTVDAAASVYSHIVDQVDAMSADHGAAAAELTGPASDNKLKSKTPLVLDDQSSLEEL